MMQIGNATTDKYFTPYKTNTNVKMINGFSLNTDGKLEVQEADETSEFKGFVAEFVDYQKFHQAWMSQGATTKYSYTENKGLNKEENSISLVPGVMIKLANGFKLKIEDSIINCIGDFRDNNAASESAAISGALNLLIKVANGQIPLNMFYSRNQNNSEYAKIGLQAAGIDTSKPFMINEKKFCFDGNGQIRFSVE